LTNLRYDTMKSNSQDRIRNKKLSLISWPSKICHVILKAGLWGAYTETHNDGNV
jgi:hypothetical protein